MIKIKKVLICYFIFQCSTIFAIAQLRPGCYLGINNLLEFHFGYERNVSHQFSVGAQLNVVVGVLPVNLYSDYFSPGYLLARPLSQNGLRLRAGLQLHSHNLKRILSAQPEVSYIYTYILRYEENPGQSGSNVKEFREQQRIGGLIFTMTHRLGYTGRWSIFYSSGVRYKLINRQYIAEGWRHQLDYSDRVEKFNRFEPVINFGVRVYFRMIED